MKRIADQIKQALSAMAMADVGEVSGRYRMEEVLNSSAAQTPTPAPPPPDCRRLHHGFGEWQTSGSYRQRRRLRRRDYWIGQCGGR